MYQGSFLYASPASNRSMTGRGSILGLAPRGPQGHDSLGGVVEDRQVAVRVVLAGEVDEAPVGLLMLANEGDRLLFLGQFPAHRPGQHGRVGHGGQVAELRVRLAGVGGVGRGSVAAIGPAAAER